MVYNYLCLFDYLFLYTGRTFAILSFFGYAPVSIARLNIFTRAGTRIGEDSFINLEENSSWPAEWELLRFVMTSSISQGKICRRNIDWGAGLLR